MNGCSSLIYKALNKLDLKIDKHPSKISPNDLENMLKTYTGEEYQVSLHQDNLNLNIKK